MVLFQSEFFQKYFILYSIIHNKEANFKSLRNFLQFNNLSYRNVLDYSHDRLKSDDSFSFYLIQNFTLYDRFLGIRNESQNKTQNVLQHLDFFKRLKVYSLQLFIVLILLACNENWPNE